MGDDLRALWDFDDLDATERRFRALLAGETSETRRAEILTQLARVEGLRGRCADGDRLLDEAELLSGGAARARVELERGRLRRSSGDAAAALPLFEAAFASALEAGDDFLAADAAHMAAIASAEPNGMVAWTERGVELAERSEAAAYWLGPLLNNHGWTRYGAGEYETALSVFGRALEARERNPERPYEIEIARYAVAKTLLALGRPTEAAELLERAVAWATNAGRPDGWFHEELALAYAALGREVEASEQAGLALPLLSAADDSFAGDTERAARLQSLADAPE